MRLSTEARVRLGQKMFLGKVETFRKASIAAESESQMEMHQAGVKHQEGEKSQSSRHACKRGEIKREIFSVYLHSVQVLVPSKSISAAFFTLLVETLTFW